MSISADSPSDETLNRGTLALLLRRQYEFPFGIVQFSIFNFNMISPLDSNPIVLISFSMFFSSQVSALLLNARWIVDWRGIL